MVTQVQLSSPQEDTAMETGSEKKSKRPQVEQPPAWCRVVHTQHLRVADWGGIKGKGGATAVVMEDDLGIRSVGVAVCSDDEMFCRRTGRNVAQRRAIEGLMAAKRFVYPAGQPAAEAIIRILPIHILTGEK